MKLDPARKIDIEELLRELEHYRPRRSGWSWRTPLPAQRFGPFVLRDTSQSLRNSVPLPSARHFGGIDPQCDFVITTEIASGRFEDDIRRMRMAAWHGADHIMVIRNLSEQCARVIRLCDWTNVLHLEPAENGDASRRSSESPVAVAARGLGASTPPYPTNAKSLGAR